MVMNNDDVVVCGVAEDVVVRLKRILGRGDPDSIQLSYPQEGGRIGKWGEWRITRSGRTINLGAALPWSILYPLFRNAFARLGVPVNSPCALVYHDADSLDEGQRCFRPSGRRILVGKGRPVTVRPAGCRAMSSWASATLSVEPNQLGGGGGRPHFGCVIDDNPRTFVRFDVMDLVVKQPTIYIRILDSNSSIAVARLVQANARVGEAVFELDQSVVR